MTNNNKLATIRYCVKQLPVVRLFRRRRVCFVCLLFAGTRRDGC